MYKHAVHLSRCLDVTVSGDNTVLHTVLVITLLACMQSWHVDKSTFFLQNLINTIESCTGVDLDGDGRNEHVEIPDYDERTSDLFMIIMTVEDGHNLGRSYVHRLPAHSANQWVQDLSQAVSDAKQREHLRLMRQKYGHNQLTLLRARSYDVFHSDMFQCFVCFVILLGFIMDMIEAQMLAESGSKLEKTFFSIDSCITLLFTFELLLNIFCHSHNFIAEFVFHPENWFDVVIVVTSLLHLFFHLLKEGGSSVPDLKTLRMVRLARVVRIITSFSALRKLIDAISSAMLPVCNAFFLLLIVAAIYAVLGTYFFRERQPAYFADFLTSLFTMFQVLTGDSWASSVSRGMFTDCETSVCKTDTGVAFFFVSYILIASLMLLNVVVAVLLGE